MQPKELLSIKAILFDLDMTLVDTSSLLSLRSERKWSEVYNRLDETKLFNSISSLIKKSKSKYKIGIVTNSPRKYAQKLIDFHNLDIPILSAFHDTKKHKPDPEPIIYGVNKLGIEPEEVIYVGDETGDIYAAKSAKCTAVGVTWGFASKNKLEEQKPDFIAENIDQLFNYLDLKKGAGQKIIKNDSDKMLSMPQIAKKLGVSTEFLRKKLQEKKYITKKDDKWTLTNKGLNSGGQYKNFYGRYIVFPETFAIPTNGSNKTLKDCRPMIFSHDAPNLIGAFYLFSYIPANKSPDDVSKLLLKFKDDNDFAVEQWIDTAVEESKHIFAYPIESIIRVLGHKEIKVDNKAKPLDKLGSAIATALGSKYEPQTLSKKQKNQSLKFLSINNSIVLLKSSAHSILHICLPFFISLYCAFLIFSDKFIDISVVDPTSCCPVVTSVFVFILLSI